MRVTRIVRAAVSLAIASILAIPGPVAAQPEEAPTLASALADRWEQMRRSYAEVRWVYLPGLRMTNAKKHELVDAALQSAVADPWFIRPHEKILLQTHPEYTPPSGLSLMLRPPPGDERVDSLSISESGHKSITSVGVYANRSFQSDAGRCHWQLTQRCFRSWKSWECETVSRTFYASTRLGTPRGKSWKRLHDSEDGPKFLALANELDARGIPITIRRSLHSAGDDSFTEGWSLDLRDVSREDEARGVIAAGASGADVESVDDRWKGSILGHGLAAEDVCRSPAAGSALVSGSR